jgi:hypothetical protein
MMRKMWFIATEFDRDMIHSSGREDNMNFSIGMRLSSSSSAENNLERFITTVLGIMLLSPCGNQFLSPNDPQTDMPRFLNARQEF